MMYNAAMVIETEKFLADQLATLPTNHPDRDLLEGLHKLAVNHLMSKSAEPQTLEEARAALYALVCPIGGVRDLTSSFRLQSWHIARRVQAIAAFGDDSVYNLLPITSFMHAHVARVQTRSNQFPNTKQALVELGDAELAKLVRGGREAGSKTLKVLKAMRSVAKFELAERSDEQS